jgi:hypothetical protein
MQFGKQLSSIQVYDHVRAGRDYHPAYQRILLDHCWGMELGLHGCWMDDYSCIFSSACSECGEAFEDATDSVRARNAHTCELTRRPWSQLYLPRRRTLLYVSARLVSGKFSSMTKNGAVNCSKLTAAFLTLFETVSQVDRTRCV